MSPPLLLLLLSANVWLLVVGRDCFKYHGDDLVTDAVSVLLDGLNSGLDDWGLSDLTDWGESVGNWGGGSDNSGGMGIGKRSSGVGEWGTCVGKWGTGVASVAEGGGSQGENGSLGGNSQDSKNNLEENILVVYFNLKCKSWLTST